MAKSRLNILNGSGHIEVLYDAERAAAGDLDAQAAVAEAERIFNTERSQGATAIRSNPGSGRPGERIDAFDPQAREITIIRQRKGG